MTDAAAAPTPTASFSVTWSRVVLRWSITLGALLVVGPIAGLLTGGLRNIDGSVHATPLNSTSPVMGVLGALVGVALACGLGAVGGRFFGPRFALRTAGFVLCWAAWRTGTIDELIRTTQSDGPLRMLAIEGVLLGVATLAGVFVMLRVARTSNPTEQEEFASAGDTKKSAWLAAGAAAVVVGAAGACFGGWLFAVEPLKGQAIFAAFLGGIAAGAFGRLGGSLVCERVPPLAMVGAIVLAAVAAPVLALVLQGTGSAIVDRVYAGTLLKVAHVLPLDWLGGGLVGLPVGMAWVGSMMVKSEARLTRADK